MRKKGILLLMNTQKKKIEIKNMKALENVIVNLQHDESNKNIHFKKCLMEK